MLGIYILFGGFMGFRFFFEIRDVCIEVVSISYLIVLIGKIKIIER